MPMSPTAHLPWRLQRMPAAHVTYETRAGVTVVACCRCMSIRGSRSRRWRSRACTAPSSSTAPPRLTISNATAALRTVGDDPALAVDLPARPRRTSHAGRARHGEPEARRPVRSNGQRRTSKRPRTDLAPGFEDAPIGGMDSNNFSADVWGCLGTVKSLTLLVGAVELITSICSHGRSGRGLSPQPYQRWR